MTFDDDDDTFFRDPLLSPSLSPSLGSLSPLSSSLSPSLDDPFSFSLNPVHFSGVLPKLSATFSPRMDRDDDPVPLPLSPSRFSSVLPSPSDAVAPSNSPCVEFADEMHPTIHGVHEPFPETIEQFHQFQQFQQQFPFPAPFLPNQQKQEEYETLGQKRKRAKIKGNRKGNRKGNQHQPALSSFEEAQNLWTLFKQVASGQHEQYINYIGKPKATAFVEHIHEVLGQSESPSQSHGAIQELTGKVQGLNSQLFTSQKLIEELEKIRNAQATELTKCRAEQETLKKQIEAQKISVLQEKTKSTTMNNLHANYEAQIEELTKKLSNQQQLHTTQMQELQKQLAQEQQTNSIQMQALKNQLAQEQKTSDIQMQELKHQLERTNRQAQQQQLTPSPTSPTTPTESQFAALRTSLEQREKQLAEQTTRVNDLTQLLNTPAPAPLPRQVLMHDIKDYMHFYLWRTTSLVYCPEMTLENMTCDTVLDQIDEHTFADLFVSDERSCQEKFLHVYCLAQVSRREANRVNPNTFMVFAFDTLIQSSKKNARKLMQRSLHDTGATDDQIANVMLQL